MLEVVVILPSIEVTTYKVSTLTFIFTSFPTSLLSTLEVVEEEEEEEEEEEAKGKEGCEE